MSVKCSICGYINPDGSAVCECCFAALSETEVSRTEEDHAEKEEDPEETEEEIAGQEDQYEYYVNCPESSTQTVLKNGEAATFFCRGCNEEHTIDGLIWRIERREKTGKAKNPVREKPAPDTATTTEQKRLRLKVKGSDQTIEIGPEGGTLGRAGDYGSEFFLSRNMMKISRIHCEFKYPDGNWIVIRRSSNDTVFNNRKLEPMEPATLINGRELVLADCITFEVLIG